MKKILIFCFLLNSSICFCQGYYPYQDIKLEKPADYKSAEPMALSAANFLMSTPFKAKDPNRQNAMTFLMSWMRGTTEIHFMIDNTAQSLAENKDLFELYSAALAKFCLENKGVSNNARLVEISTSKMILAYCDNPANNFSLKKKFRKRLESN